MTIDDLKFPASGDKPIRVRLERELTLPNRVRIAPNTIIELSHDGIFAYVKYEHVEYKF